MSRNYYSTKGDTIHILHFPGSGLMKNEKHILENIGRKFSISDKVSIVSVMNKACYETSMLREQCDNNRVPIINTAYDVEEWTNTVKIPKILEALKQVSTQYCLILDGRDVLVSNDLENEFIDKYKSFNTPIIYNATYVRHPKTCVETLQDIIHIQSKHKYLNAGVCMGETEALRNFYTKVLEISKQYPDNDSEQLIVRIARKKYPELAGYDYNNRLFAAVHYCENVFTETENGWIFH